MPSHGLNLATYKQEFLAQLEFEYMRGSSARTTEAQIFARLTQAQTWLANRLKIPGKIDTTAVFSSGSAYVTLPDDCVGGGVDGVLVQVSGADDYYPLDRISDERGFTERCRLTPTLETGWPEAYSWDAENRRIVLFPCPNIGGSVAIRYSGRPRPLSRIFNPAATVAASVTYASASVSLSGTATWANKIRVGDEFGLMPDAQSDGTATGTECPVVWYRVSAVGEITLSESTYTGTLTLSDAWDGDTASSQRFMAAQVSDLEARIGGRLGFAPVYRALRDAMVGSAPEPAAAWLALAEDAIREYGGDGARTKPKGRQQNRYFTGSFRNGTE